MLMLPAWPNPFPVSMVMSPLGDSVPPALPEDNRMFPLLPVSEPD